MHISNSFKHQNISKLFYFHDFFGRFIFHLHREFFHSYERIIMKLFLFRGKTWCSDKPTCSRDLSFRDIFIDTK